MDSAFLLDGARFTGIETFCLLSWGIMFLWDEENRYHEKDKEKNSNNRKGTTTQATTRRPCGPALRL
jgi:hypothetical protein